MEVAAVHAWRLQLRTHHPVIYIQQPPLSPPHSHSHPGAFLLPSACVRSGHVPKVSSGCPQLLWGPTCQRHGQELGDSPICSHWMGKRLKTVWRSRWHRGGMWWDRDHAVTVAALGPGQVPRQAGGDQQLLGGDVADLHHLPLHWLRGHGAAHLLREGRLSAHRHHGECWGGTRAGGGGSRAPAALTEGLSARRVPAAPLWLSPLLPES